MPDTVTPPWLDAAARYVSLIRGNDEVHMFSPPSTEPLLRLEPQARALQIIDAAGHRIGVIRQKGIVPLRKFILESPSSSVWTLSPRSIVLKRYELLQGGDRWEFTTPFFRRQGLAGSVDGHARMLGNVGKSKMEWRIYLQQEYASWQLLAAIALLYRQWWRH